MPTPHINANLGDFADIVLMPGDPLRAKFIADEWLSDVVQVNDVRNMLGFTGTYKGKRISVMGHGMGIPSVSIYTTELIKDFGVKTIIRVGSCGALNANLKVRDVIIAMGASTDSNVNRMRFMGYDFAAIANYNLLRTAVDTAEALGKPVKVGNVFSADLFYTPQPQMFDVLEKMNVLAVEMELAGMYGVAAEYGADVLGILTVSDHIRTGEAASSDERQSSFRDMIDIALETALKY
ncbi:purine-nucleoside phosphorylase [Leeia sp. TBRC 13508]|uniref:Purine nucleoside phosphorylase DeoD-type n=1 Tax=Leeia speluncae TaxID=2884804 RepID=A0ABS8D778_9NEIS|nr:purine-nucleoside phosphorylase [Leeia speluncae]MCB6183992.1 purine-nucleoside phosphorylase [Leeia speluncae]